MMIRKAKASDKAFIISLWNQSFPLEKQASNEFFFDHLFQLDDTYLLVDHNEIVCMMQTRNMDVMLNEEAINVPFIVGIATPERYRRKGYMRHLFHYVLSYLKKRVPFVILQAYDWNLYQPYGFQVTHYLQKVKVDVDYYSSTTYDYHITQHAENSDLVALYQCYTKDKNGYRIRDISYYDNYLKPYLLSDEAKWLCVFSTSNELKGYAIYHEYDSIHIDEFIYVDESVKEAMLYQFSTMRKEVILLCSEEDSIYGITEKIPAMMMKKFTEFEYNGPLFINEVL